MSSTKYSFQIAGTEQETAAREGAGRATERSLGWARVA